MKVLLVGAATMLAVAAAAASPRTVPRGERAFARCVACHALEAAADTPAGPTLHGLRGRRIAGRPGFDYSPAMRRFASRHRRWTPELLERFLEDPEAIVPGTEMSFDGLSDAAERRALINWLRRRR